MYNKLMVPLDGSKLAECVFPHLETVTRGCLSTPEIELVTAVEPIAVPRGREVSRMSSLDELTRYESHQQTDAEGYLKEKVAYLKERGIAANSRVVMGRAGEALSKYANENSVDLIIMSTHGRSGVNRLVWGSIAEHVLRNVHAPVLMVRAATYGPGPQDHAR